MAFQMSKKKQVIVVAIAAIVCIAIVAGLGIWAELSWNKTQAAMIASTNQESSSSSIDGNSNASSVSDSSDTSKSSSVQTDSVSSTSDKGTAGGSLSSTDANDPGDGVARDTKTVTNTTNSTNGKVVAQVALSWWDADSSGIHANGSVNNFIESNGTCTLIATQGSNQVTASNKSIADATTTACGEITIPRNQIAKGTWQMHISYSSQAASGNSDHETVQVN